MASRLEDYWDGRNCLVGKTHRMVEIHGGQNSDFVGLESYYFDMEVLLQNQIGLLTGGREDIGLHVGGPT